MTTKYCNPLHTGIATPTHACHIFFPRPRNTLLQLRQPLPYETERNPTSSDHAHIRPSSYPAVGGRKHTWQKFRDKSRETTNISEHGQEVSPVFPPFSFLECLSSGCISAGSPWVYVTLWMDNDNRLRCQKSVLRTGSTTASIPSDKGILHFTPYNSQQCTVLSSVQYLYIRIISCSLRPGL